LEGGLLALKRDLGFRLYAHISVQEIIEMDEKRFCKEVGIVEYSEFARAIDPRIETPCVACPPDPHPDEYWCAWEFSIEQQ
jgi:hypothetical protein